MAGSELKNSELPHLATLRSFLRTNEFGEDLVESPVEIYSRWEEDRREATTENGSKVAITHQIFVDREVTLGSILRRGALEDEPQTPDNLVVVVAYSETEDLKGLYVERHVLVAKTNNKIRGA